MGDINADELAAAVAAATLPQIDQRIEAGMGRAVEAVTTQVVDQVSTQLGPLVTAQLKDLGVLDEAGAVARPPVVRSTHEDAGPFATFGHQLVAIKAASMGDNGARTLLVNAAASGAGEAVDADGGFMILPQFTSGIEKRMHDTGRILSLITPTDVTGNSLTIRRVAESSRATGSRNGAVQGYWVDEGTAPDASRMKFERVEYRLKKVGAVGYATDELVEDVTALGQEMEAGFADELVFLVEDAIVEGVGAGQPAGIKGASCTVTVSKETGQAAATIRTANLSKMWARMHSRSKATAVWLINTDCNPQLDELTIPAGTAAVEPRFVTYGPDGALRIKGRPVIEVEYCDTLGTKGDIVLADFSQYQLIQKAGGVQQASSMHVRFIQDEMTFRATYRVDGGPKWKSALTPFKGSATVSPFVNLETRS
ncbi:MAG: phage major capsid protein [Dehalococcoidia bacterium]